MTRGKRELAMLALLLLSCLVVTGCPCECDNDCQDAGVDAGQDGGQDAGDDGGDQPEPVSGFGPASRWIGWRSMDTASLGPLDKPCPPPTVADPNWRYGRLFAPRDVLEQLGGLDALDQPNDIGNALLATIDSVGTPDAWYRNVLGSDGVFCLYEWLGEPVSEEQSEDLMSQIPLIRTGAPDPDPPALVPLDMTPEELTADIRGRFHLHALEQLGASGYTPAVGLDQSPVIVAIMDSAVTDYGDPAIGQGLPGEGQLVHGRDVGLLARRMTCPDNRPVDARTGCKIGLANYLVLDREPDEAGGTRINRVEGGYFGTPGTLAEMIWWTVVMWQYRNPGAKLVINMSVGWEESGPHLDRTDHVVQSVRAALSNARCAGALPIVAAGNSSGGPNPSTGPMGPAFFENYDWDGCDPVAPSSEPMVYSVGGIDGSGRPLASTRAQGRPRLSAYAYQVPFDEQYLVPGTPADPVFGSPPLTGTSMSAAATSAIAAMLWSYSPDVSAGKLMDAIFDTGTLVEGSADYCRGSSCSYPNDIHRASLCAALDSVGAIQPGTCTEPVYQDPTWSDEQLAEADQIATSVGLPTLTSQPAPVQDCGADTSIYFDAQGQLPVDICPDATNTNYIPMPQLVPQPRKPVCPTCNFVANSLYIGDDSGTGLITSLLLDATPGTVDSVRLKLSNASQVVYYDIQGALVPGEIIRVDGFVLPDGFVPELAEVIAILTGHTGTAITLNGQIPVMVMP